MKSLQLSTLVAVAFGVIAFLVLRANFPGINTSKFSALIGLIAVLGWFVGVWLGRRGGRK